MHRAYQDLSRPECDKRKCCGPADSGTPGAQGRMCVENEVQYTVVLMDELHGFVKIR